jgi:ABC-type glycerol-3-phosphate transport system substrate-binding protein
MKKIVGAGAAALMTVTVLAGCGGSDSGGSSGGYCDDLKSTKTTITSLGDADMTQANFEKLTGDLRTIADEAPSDIKGDWGTLADAIDTFTAAMKDAGITFDNLQKINQPGGPTLAPADLTKITDAAGALDADAITKASANIKTEAKSECDVDLDIGN